MTLVSITEEGDDKRRWLRRSLFGGLAVLFVLYVAGFLLTGARMPANATIAGVDVGGMSPSAAKVELDKALTPKLDDEIVFTTVAGKAAKSAYRSSLDLGFKPSSIGLSFDLQRSIDEAGGKRSFNPVKMVGLLFGDHAFAPVVDADKSQARDFVDGLGDLINVDVIEAQITYKHAKPIAREPVAGLIVDQDKTIEAAKAAYLVATKPVTIPTLVVEPAVDSAGLAKAMTEIGRPAVSGPITLHVGKKDVPLAPSAFAPALVIAVKDGALAPYIDPKKLEKPLTDSTTGIGSKAVDASYKIEGNKATVIPSKVGLGLQPKEMATQLIPVLSKTGGERSLEIKAKAVEPDFTTDEANKLGIKTRISSFTTYYPPAAYRDTNQSRAAQLIDGTIIKPGQTFSFNNTVGERTKANGFVIGTVINGGVFREEQGGGVSQVVTTTYNAAFFGGLTDIEHHPHDLYISRYPVGREATVYWGSLDLRFRNDTKYGVLIRANVVKSAGRPQGATTVSMFSTKVWDIKAGLSAKSHIREPAVRYDPTDRCVPQAPSIGFDVDVYRYFYRGGVKVKTETDTAHYRATDDVRCRENPKKN
ncbi:MAG: VanW family protein [Aeromicrobium sp.]